MFLLSKVPSKISKRHLARDSPFRNFRNTISSEICLSEIFGMSFRPRFAFPKFSKRHFVGDLPFRNFRDYFNRLFTIQFLKNGSSISYFLVFIRIPFVANLFNALNIVLEVLVFL